MKDEPDLNFLIATIRHVVENRNITSNYQVGGWLLTGLERTLNYRLLRTIGMLSPFVLRAIMDGNVEILQRQAIEFSDPIYAANLCLSLLDHNPDDVIAAAMDKLETTGGKVINQYVPAGNNGSATEYWTRSRQPSPLPSLDAKSQAAQLRVELDAARKEVAEASMRLATTKAWADKLNAENQSFRRSRVLRLWRAIRRVQ
jgi:hypothetical protein